MGEACWPLRVPVACWLWADSMAAAAAAASGAVMKRSPPRLFGSQRPAMQMCTSRLLRRLRLPCPVRPKARPRQDPAQPALARPRPSPQRQPNSGSLAKLRQALAKACSLQRVLAACWLWVDSMEATVVAASGAVTRSRLPLRSLSFAQFRRPPSQRSRLPKRTRTLLA